MELRRTANAGVLLKMDDAAILLDGVCLEVSPYLATPPEEREYLLENLPDILVYTHEHRDHFDVDFAKKFQARTVGEILCPMDVDGCVTRRNTAKIGNVEITPIPSRHIRCPEAIQQHFSYILQGTKCVWFMGDASPLQWHNVAHLPKPDVLIAPFAYASTEASWRRTKDMGAQTVVLLHLPDKGNDPYALWQAVESVTADDTSVKLITPDIGAIISL